LVKVFVAALAQELVVLMEVTEAMEVWVVTLVVFIMPSFAINAKLTSPSLITSVKKPAMKEVVVPVESMVANTREELEVESHGYPLLEHSLSTRPTSCLREEMERLTQTIFCRRDLVVVLEDQYKSSLVLLREMDTSLLMEEMDP
jgi:hypothetical protein